MLCLSLTHIMCVYCVFNNKQNLCIYYIYIVVYVLYFLVLTANMFFCYLYVSASLQVCKLGLHSPFGLHSACHEAHGSVLGANRTLPRRGPSKGQIGPL